MWKEEYVLHKPNYNELFVSHVEIIRRDGNLELRFILFNACTARVDFFQFLFFFNLFKN